MVKFNGDIIVHEAELAILDVERNTAIVAPHAEQDSLDARLGNVHFRRDGIWPI